MTPKQKGDACEMLVAAEMTLAGMPTMKMPDNWPGYDLIAQPKEGGAPQRISVKARVFRTGAAYVEFWGGDQFDWGAIVLLPSGGELSRRVFIAPRNVVDKRFAHPKGRDPRDLYLRLDRIIETLKEFENNYCLSMSGLNQQR